MKAFLRIDYHSNLPHRGQNDVKTWMGEVSLEKDLHIIERCGLYKRDVNDEDIHEMYVHDGQGFAYEFILRDLDGNWKPLNDNWWAGSFFYGVDPQKFRKLYLPTFPKKYWKKAAIQNIYFQFM